MREQHCQSIYASFLWQTVTDSTDKHGRHTRIWIKFDTFRMMNVAATGVFPLLRSMKCLLSSCPAAVLQAVSIHVAVGLQCR